MKSSNLSSNIWKFGVHFATNKRAYMTFMTIFLLTMPNATARTIGLLTLIGQLAGFIFEIPSGYFADTIGHKRAMVISRIMLILSTACYLFATSSMWFIVATIFLSAGWSFSSGTDSALLHNTLRSLGREEDYSRIRGRLSSFGFALAIVFIIALALIAEQNFRMAFIVALVIDIVGLFVVALMVEPARSVRKVEEFGLNSKEALREFISAGWLPYILFGVLTTSIALGATMGFKNPFQESLGFSITAIGLLWALSRVFLSVTLLANNWIHRTFSFRSFLLFSACLYGIAFLGIALTGNKWLIALLFIISNTVMWGFDAAKEQYYFGYIGASRFKATHLSIIRLLGNIVVAVTGLIMGYLVINLEYSGAYLAISISGLVIMIAGFIFLPRLQKTTRRSN